MLYSEALQDITGTATAQVNTTAGAANGGGSEVQTITFPSNGGVSQNYFASFQGGVAPAPSELS